MNHSLDVLVCLRDKIGSLRDKLQVTGAATFMFLVSLAEEKLFKDLCVLYIYSNEGFHSLIALVFERLLPLDV